MRDVIKFKNRNKAMLQNKMTCYLIDDDPEEFEIFKLALEQLDISVACQYFGMPAQAVTFKNKPEYKAPDFIFLDINIPSVVIADEIETLRKSFAYPQTQLHLYSSYLPKNITEVLGKKDHIGYLPKLPTIDQLTSNLSTLMTGLSMSLCSVMSFAEIAV
jgi:CheY-like chemotaxis protein